MDGTINCYLLSQKGPSAYHMNYFPSNYLKQMPSKILHFRAKEVVPQLLEKDYQTN